MTTDEINRRIAEAVGWREAFPALKEPHPLTKRPGIMLPYRWVNERTKERVLDLPDFARDLNEMHEAENALMETDLPAWYRYVDLLYPQNRAEAFLRAIGRWE